MSRTLLATAVTLTTAALTTACSLATPNGLFDGAASSGPHETVDTTLHDAISELSIADEVRDGYDRDKYKHWIDEDGDGCDTRYEVLIAEAVEDPEVSDDCDLTGGKWLSYYDNEEFTDPSDLDIDHMVPLAESWDSGASDWTDDDRERYANDLDEDAGLVAVSASSNRQKGDQDPAEWMPSEKDVSCQYITEWTIVKTRWRLSVDEAEQTALEEISADCENVDLTIEYAMPAS